MGAIRSPGGSNRAHGALLRENRRIRKRPGFPGRFGVASMGIDQKRYLKLAMIDQRETPVLPLSLLFSWMSGSSVLPEKL